MTSGVAGGASGLVEGQAWMMSVVAGGQVVKRRKAGGGAAVRRPQCPQIEDAVGT